MMKHLKTCCFLGLALLLLTLPVRSAELPPEVERALPREAGQLLKDVDHWDAFRRGFAPSGTTSEKT